MPAKYLLSWEPKTRRWTKMYKRVRYAISCAQLSQWCGKRVPETKEGSYQVANDWWRQRRLQLDGGAVESPEAIEVRRRRDWCLANGRPDEAAEWDETLRAVARFPGLFEMSKFLKASRLLEETGVDAGTLTSMTDEWIDKVVGEEAWAARLGPMVSSAAYTLGRALEEYRAYREAGVLGGKITRSTLVANLNALAPFIEFLGPDTAVEAIDEGRWEAYCLHLMGRADHKPSYKHRLQVAAKSFVSWLASRKRIALPANLSQRFLAISVTTPKIRTLDADVCRQLIEVFPPHLRICVLLGLNCLFTQADMAELRHDEVDWQQGRICRKRSKTRNKGGTPEVEFLLWSETFSLLRELRSDDPDRVLLSGGGRPWIVPGSDRLAAAWRDYTTRRGIKGTTPKLLRKTSATLLGSHPEFRFYSQHALGHAPDDMASERYVKPDQPSFDRAILWLRGQYFGG